MTTELTIDSIARPWGRLVYRRTGSGAPFVLLHPLALSGALWEPFIDDFAPGHELIVPDLRGHGASRADGESFSLDDMAADVLALLDALELGRCIVLGMSMGGSVATTLAAHWPSRVERLLLCDTTAWYGEDAAAKWAERAHAARTKTRDEQIPFQMDRWFSEAFRREQPALAGHVCELFRATTGEAHARACLAMGALDVRGSLPAITARTFVVTGEEDYATPPEMGRALAAAIPGARFELWPGARHMAVVESPSLRAQLQRFAS